MPKASKKTNKQLVTAIAAAAVLISGSMVFAGFQFGNRLSDQELQVHIIQGVDTYFKLQQQRAQAAKQPKYIEGDFTDDDAILGDKNAPVTIVEFSDFQCPYCAKFYSGAYQDIKKNYVESGKVKFIFRDLPLNGHAGAYPAALAAECAGDQGRYYEMHDAIFENQAILTGESGHINNGLKELASNIGLDSATFNDCYDNEKFKEEIVKDASEAANNGIGGTPAFIVGNQFISGAQPYEVFAAAIEEALNR